MAGSVTGRGEVWGTFLITHKPVIPGGARATAKRDGKGTQ